MSTCSKLLHVHAFPTPPVKMEILIIVKCLFFLEGLLLSSFTPNILLNKCSTALIYGLGYISSFAWVWYADQSRAIAPILITCLTLSMALKWTLRQLFVPDNLAAFFTLFSTSMIIPLTCAFTMMQCNPRQERESWSFQYSFLLLGRLARTFIPEKQTGLLFDSIVSLIFAVFVVSIPWIQARNLAAKSIDPKEEPPQQIHTPISELIGQARYLYFLVSVLFASFFFCFTRKTILDEAKISVSPLPSWILLSFEILTCWAAYFLCPHRIPPQRFFLLAQILIASRFLLFYFAPSWIEISDLISSIGFVVFSVANAQIVATHGKPGLEYTTCALVDIMRNGLGPVVFVLLRSYLGAMKVALIGCTIFTMGFVGKYFLVDYPHDKLIKKRE